MCSSLLNKDISQSKVPSSELLSISSVSSKTVYLDSDRIDLNNLLLSTVCNCKIDFTPLNTQRVGSVNKYLKSKQIPSLTRDIIPVLHCDKHVYFVIGHTISDTVKLTKNTTSVLCVKYNSL